MRKKLSVVKRMLAFVLTFAMAFTAISWGDVGEVMALAEETNLLTNGDFSTGDTSDWAVTTSGAIEISVATLGQYAKNNTTDALHFYNGGETASGIELAQRVTLEKGDYTLSAEADGENEKENGLSLYVVEDGTDNVVAQKAWGATAGWDNWTTCSVDFKLTESKTVIIKIAGDLPSGCWGDVDNIELEKVVQAQKSLTNGDFSTGDTSDWTVTTSGAIEISVATLGQYAKNNTTDALHFYNGGETASGIELAQRVTLEKGDYTLSAEADGENEKENGLSLYVVEDGTDNVVAQKAWGATTGWDAWTTCSVDFKLTESKTVIIKIAGDLPSGCWGDVDNIELKKVVQAQKSLTNGDFSTGDTSDWTVTTSGAIEISVATLGQYAKNNTTDALHFYNGGETASGIELAQRVTLEKGDYTLSAEADGENEKENGLSLYVVEDGTDSVVAQKAWGATAGWDNWTICSVDFKLTESKTVTIKIAGDLPAQCWGDIDNIIITKKVVEPAESNLYVPYVEGITDDDGFYRGADVSSYLAIKKSGAVYKDADNQPLDDVGFFKLLKDSGVNTVRIRVWNNPFDAQGNGYGGGNNDLDAAITMGKWATKAGLGVLIDFHYSDFWADPGKQKAPKAWANYGIDQKATAIHDYTADSLEKLLDEGVNVTMVQVGNETNGSMCGVSGTGDWTENLDLLFDAGCDAIHEVGQTYNKEIKAVVHFTNPESSGRQAGYAAKLAAGQVDYDVFATSYYPYWHGSLENLTSVLSNIAKTYDKEVMVAETSWATTLLDGDGHENTVRVGNNDAYNTSDESVKYLYTEQGQVNEMASVVKAVKAVGDKGIGVFYWEPIWIPVEYAYNEDGSLNEEKLTSNKAKWEQFGSGWASSYATEYDPNDAGKWYGGSAIDNQSWFDFNGKALEAINVFKYLQTGTTADGDAVAQVVDASVEMYASETLSLPSKVSVINVSGQVTEKGVTWEKADNVDNNVPGEYVVNGAVDGIPVNCKVTVLQQNYIKNGGFESYKAFSMDSPDKFNEDAFEYWTLSNRNFNTQDVTSNNRSGLVGLHFAKKENDSATATQTVTLDKGKYELSAYLSGGAQTDEEIGISITVGGQKYENREGVLNGWQEWEQLKISDIVVPQDNTEVTVCLFVDNATTAWGAFDDVVLIHAHTYTLVEAKAASCVDDGNKEYYICEECGSIFSDNQGTQTTKENVVIPAGHEMTLHEAVAPTYSAAGNKKYYECNNCHKYFEDDQAKKEIEDKTSIVIDKLVYTGSGSGSGSSSTPDSSADNKNDSTTTKNPDGTTTETKTETTTNESGKEVETTVTTKKDADGKVTGSTEVSTIAGAAKDTAVTVTVEKDAKGNVAEAAAEVTKKGTETEEGTKGTISAAVVQQIKEAAGSANVAITTSVTGADGKEKYSVTVSADDLVAGAKLTVVVKDAKTGKAVLVDAKQVKVTAKGNVSVVLPEGNDYTLIDAKEAAKVTKEILKTVEPAKTSATLKAGKANTAKLSKKLDMDNVKKITYTTSKKGVVTVNKNGKVVAKKAGTATITIKVTLNNGKTKTVKMKYTVK